MKSHEEGCPLWASSELSDAFAALRRSERKFAEALQVGDLKAQAALGREVGEAWAVVRRMEASCTCGATSS